MRRRPAPAALCGLTCVIMLGGCATTLAPRAVFDVRDFGASGQRGDDAGPALQRAIDACGAAGGGTVLLPPGEYTSGSLRLRSHVRVLVDSGATVFSAKGKAAFPTEALFSGEDLQGITLEGRGTIDGRAEYEWRENDIDDRYIHPNLVLMQAAGKPLRRAFPTSDSVGHLVRLVRCADVQIRGLSFLRSPSWTMHLWGCDGVVIEGVTIRTSLTEGVWADGIDPDGCRDLRVANCTIETGDDALVFYSSDRFGPARPCENITVTNCRLTSSSSAIKFCDGNLNCIRNVAIDNCVITDSNRGIAFMVFDGGAVSDVVISNLTIECTRRDWFWWGDGDPIHFNVKRRCEIDPRRDPAKEPAAGSVRNVLIRNVIARGAATNLLHGHPESPLENVTIDGLLLDVTTDPGAPYEKAEHALDVRYARNLALRNVEVRWGAPESPRWKSALAVASVRGLTLEGFAGRPAHPADGMPSVLLEDVEHALLRGCKALPGTGEFVRVRGSSSRDIQLVANDFREAIRPSGTDTDVGPDAVQSMVDLLRPAPAAPAATKSVWLLSIDSDRKIQTIKVVRELTGLGLADAKALVEGPPRQIKPAAGDIAPEEIRRRLEEIGARVELR